MRWDERQLWSLGSQFRPVKLLLVMKYWCAIMNLREKHCTKRRKSASNRKKEIHLRRGQCTRYSSTRAESCYKKTREDGEKKAWLENTIENLCSLRSADLTRESDRTPSCEVSQTTSWLTHLISSASSRRCISRTLKLCLTLPTPLILPLVTFSCSRISPKKTKKNVLLLEDSAPYHP